MKKLASLVFTLLTFTILSAQQQEAEKSMALDLVSKNRFAAGLTSSDLQNSIISSTYLTRDGIRMVYLQQSYAGVPVYNQLSVLAFKNEQLVSKTGGRISAIEKLVSESNAKPDVSVVTALKTAFDELEAVPSEAAVPVYISSDGKQFEFGKLGASSENIKAELLWYPVPGKNEIRLVWQYFIAPLNDNKYWLVRIDAKNNSFIDKTNLTITCNWDHKGHSIEAHLNEQQPVQKNYFPKQTIGAFNPRTDVINSVSYRVVKYPAESPIHPGGLPSLHIDPWLLAGNPASSLGWHNDGTILHDSTRGNNVWAQEDRDANNTTVGRAATSTTPQPVLTLEYTYDFTKAPTDPTSENQKAAITNLFYWNNIIHDLAYIYGFDEPSGNFQNNNQGRGGLGNDYVMADAQDAAGTNNANFSTGADGSRPRMQMYLWTAPNPDRDGDMDNGIIVHEYTHGISNRYTGGPATASCLGNNEQGGEGWSDYFALMSTTNWATATVNDGPLRRGMGTYALNQPINGTGIRRFPYSTDMSIYPLTYADLPGSAIPHGVGEIWCMMLWEMTWEIIRQDNAINPNLFAPGILSNMIGNSAALKLVSEGMRLQPCNPGFVDARNAILKADTIFFNKKYSCSIWKAFAKRGLGRNAVQGSAASIIDGVADYTVDASAFTVSGNLLQAQEGQNVTYTNSITAGNCSPVVNFFVTDTLPANVTYVSGGTYNATNRTVTFNPITMASGATQTFPFTVTVNNGTYFAPVTHLNETVPTATIPSGWSVTSTTTLNWTVSSVFSNSAPNAFFASNPVTVSDYYLTTSGSYTLLPVSASHYTTLSFWHRFNTEDGWDGGVVEISTNGGSSWTDLGSKMISGKYNGSIGSGSALVARQAFTGTINSFMKTTINLSSYAGQTVKIRFRFASDNNTAPAGGGWYVDDILLKTEPAVVIKSNLFNATGVLQSVTDTVTRILPVSGCTPVTINTQPANANACAGSSASFAVSVNGTSPGYQWQVNPGTGFVDIVASSFYSGTNSNTLIISGVISGMSGYQYRCVISNACSSPVISNAATLTVGAVATISTQPQSITACTGAITSFSATVSGATGYQWQVNTGSGFVNLTNIAPYSGVTTPILTITGINLAMNNYQYRLVIGSCPAALNSNTVTLSVHSPASITAQPLPNIAVCDGASTSVDVTATGSIVSIQWQRSVDGGTNFTDIPGANGTALALTRVTLAQNANRYRVVITGNCNTVISNNMILTVNPVPSFTLGAIPASMCISDTAITLTASDPGGAWTGNGVQFNKFLPRDAGLGIAVIIYTMNNNFGCSASQATSIQVNECPERHITLNRDNSFIIYPNPNSGRFNIRIKTDLYTKLGLRVYGSEGRLVAVREITGIYYDRVAPVDLSNLAGGVYHLYFYNIEQGTLVSRTVKIIISR